jgi:hypothetical protein
MLGALRAITPLFEKIMLTPKTFTDFQRECNINSNSYSRFMKLKGPYSRIDNQTYEAA